ncbi:MAG: NAD(+) synthase, partial [Anaerolineae bacterium]|nr:NAD(+) synthase [Anaerolineae bacterium]
MDFHKDVLKINSEVMAETLVQQLQHDIRQKLRRSGAVVGISGGVDSSVVLALCVRAFGA